MRSFDLKAYDKRVRDAIVKLIIERDPKLREDEICQRRSKNRPCGGAKVYRLGWVRSLSP